MVKSGKFKRCVTKILIILLFSIFFTQAAFAEDPDRILSNSEDWRDVYSSMVFGSLIQKPVNFLVSDRHATLILNSISKENHLWVISSNTIPYVVGYRNLLEGRGYSVEEFTYSNINLELASLLEDVTNFVIIDDSYGYNAIAVAPYAVTTKSYVLFADEDNIGYIDDFLSGRQVDKMLIYGNVDRQVRNTLRDYNPEIINEEGDRFLNNIEIVKKYQEVANQKQTILTNGEFIEQEIMSGREPVIFIGTNNVPDAIRKYVQESDIEVGVLIGNELVGTATFVRRQMGISVFVKFAQGARAPQGSISQVEALDMFYLPVYNLNLEIDSIKYNRATDLLEVSLRNTEDQAVYAIGSYALTASDSSRQTVGDLEAKFIDGNEIKTFTYAVNPMPEGPISADIFVIYGESRGSLEKEIRTTLQVDSVRILDNCEIAKDDFDAPAIFNLRTKNFFIEVENIGSTDCFVDAELFDVIVANQKTTYGLDSVIKLPAGSKKELKIKASGMEEEDLEDNEKVRARIYYGERENVLSKVFEREYSIKLKKGNLLSYVLIIIIILLLFLIVWKRRKKKEHHHKV